MHPFSTPKLAEKASARDPNNAAIRCVLPTQLLIAAVPPRHNCGEAATDATVGVLTQPAAAVQPLAVPSPHQIPVRAAAALGFSGLERPPQRSRRQVDQTAGVGDHAAHGQEAVDLAGEPLQRNRHAGL